MDSMYHNMAQPGAPPQLLVISSPPLHPGGHLIAGQGALGCRIWSLYPLRRDPLSLPCAWHAFAQRTWLVGQHAAAQRDHSRCDVRMTVFMPQGAWRCWNPMPYAQEA